MRSSALLIDDFTPQNAELKRGLPTEGVEYDAQGQERDDPPTPARAYVV